MDRGDCWASGETRKRKSLADKEEEEEEEGVLSLCFDELNQDLLEKVLSWLPTSTFFRLSSVCKRWKSVAASSSFLVACSQIPSRHPWFFMVDPHAHTNIIFDSAEQNWKQLMNYPPFLHQQQNSRSNIIPVASSGGLICFRSTTTTASSAGEFIVCNPLTGSFRHLPPPKTHQSLHAIGMNSSSKSRHNSYKLVLVYGDLPNLSSIVYNSGSDRWEEERMLNGKVDSSLGPESNGDDDDSIYFLSKAGNVVSTNMQRSPSKQYTSVLVTTKDGKEEEENQEMIYFLSSSGSIVACNLTHKSFYEYPRLLPVFSEYSIDVVECEGEMLVVVLSEFLESASLRVWKYNEDIRTWHQIAAMPPAMSHELYGKKVDINCSGAGHQILVCLNSTELCGYVLCDLRANQWVELPACYVNGKAKEFMSAFSFEPRIEASV